MYTLVMAGLMLFPWVLALCIALGSLRVAGAAARQLARAKRKGDWQDEPESPDTRGGRVAA